MRNAILITIHLILILIALYDIATGNYIVGSIRFFIIAICLFLSLERK